MVMRLLAAAGRQVSLRSIQRARRARYERDPFFSSGPLADTWYLQQAATAAEDNSNPHLSPEDRLWRTLAMAAWDMRRDFDEVEFPFTVWREAKVPMEYTSEQAEWLRSLAATARQVVEGFDVLLASPRRRGRKRVRKK
jgi:hypothetical protein